MGLYDTLKERRAIKHYDPDHRVEPTAALGYERARRNHDPAADSPTEQNALVQRARVRPEPGDAMVTKHRFNAFRNTDLDTILRARGVRTIVMTGVATNVCVETTARDGFMHDYYVVFTDDGTAAYAEEDHEATLRNIARYFGQVVDLADLRQIWMANEERASE